MHALTTQTAFTPETSSASSQYSKVESRLPGGASLTTTACGAGSGTGTAGISGAGAEIARTKRLSKCGGAEREPGRGSLDMSNEKNFGGNQNVKLYFWDRIARITYQEQNDNISCKAVTKEGP